MKSKIQLDFNGKKLNFISGLVFLSYVDKNFNWSLSDIGEGIQKNPHVFTPKLMFESYKFATERLGEKVIFSEIEFIELLDENGGLYNVKGAASLFIDFFMDSLGLNQDLGEKKEDNDVKKK